MNVFLLRERLKDAKRIVIKIESNTIIKDDRFNLRLAEDIARHISTDAREFIIVSSGAVGLGKKHIRLENKNDIIVKQCLASVGQNQLMNSFSNCFRKYDTAISQLLLTHEDIKDLKRKDNVKNIIDRLTSFGITTIINENDSVSTEEISFGDNDILSAHISNLIDADILIILSNVDGLYKDMDTKEIVSLVKDADIARGYVTQTKSELGCGGMGSKINAAEIASISETVTVVVNGNEEDVIRKIFEGAELGTIFTLNGGLKNE